MYIKIYEGVMVQNGIGKMQYMVSSTVYIYDMSNVGYEFGGYHGVKC